MQTLVYSFHLEDNHRLIAQRIREERPSVYFAESPESLQPIYDEFSKDKSIDPKRIVEMIHERSKWRFRSKGFEYPLAAARDVGARIIAAESDTQSSEWAQYQAENVVSLLSFLGDRVGAYRMAKKVKQSGKMPTGLEAIPLLMFEDPDITIKDYENELGIVGSNLQVLAVKEIERENHFAEVVSQYADVDLFGYFGYLHRTTSHLLQRRGIRLPAEPLGNILLGPEEKLSLLIKYERLGLNPQELKTEDPVTDVDPSNRQHYLGLSPLWQFYHDWNKDNFSYEEIIRTFWNTIDKL